MERKIQTSNLPDVDEIDRAKIDSTLETTYDKIAKIVGNNFILKANFKDIEKGGARKQHEVHLHISGPGFEVMAKETEWNLITALQKATSVLERETIKKVKQP